MGYREELEKVRAELLEREDQYITFRDLVERFDDVENEYLGKAWNLLQIYNNFNILIGEKKIDSPDTGKEETTTEQEMAISQAHTVELPWKELKGCQEACQEALSALNRIRGIDEKQFLHIMPDPMAGQSELTVAMEEAAKRGERI